MAESENSGMQLKSINRTVVQLKAPQALALAIGLLRKYEALQKGETVDLTLTHNIHDIVTQQDHAYIYTIVDVE